MLDTTMFDEDRVMVYNDILMSNKDMVHEKDMGCDMRYGKEVSNKIKSEFDMKDDFLWWI